MAKPCRQSESAAFSFAGPTHLCTEERAVNQSGGTSRCRRRRCCPAGGEQRSVRHSRVSAATCWMWPGPRQATQRHNTVMTARQQSITLPNGCAAEGRQHYCTNNIDSFTLLSSRLVWTIKSTYYSTTIIGRAAANSTQGATSKFTLSLSQQSWVHWRDRPSTEYIVSRAVSACIFNDSHRPTVI